MEEGIFRVILKYFTSACKYNKNKKEKEMEKEEEEEEAAIP